MHYVIQKSNWLRNQRKDKQGQKYSYPGGQLLNKLGQMCCLGFCSIQKGATPDEIRGLDLPGDIQRSLPGLNERSGPGHGYVDTELSSDAYVINDSGDTTDTEKIEKLTALFNKHRHTIEFVD